MLGYAFMGKAHAHAYRTLSYMMWPPPLVPELIAISGRDADKVAAAATRYGFATSATEWRDVVTDERVGLFDNSGPNHLHAEPTMGDAGVQHLCAFNYRFVPAVRLAREIIASGDLGEIHHFRGSYLQDWGAADIDAWRFDQSLAGSGALGDLGAHVIDLARYLVGEIADSKGSIAFDLERLNELEVHYADSGPASGPRASGAYSSPRPTIRSSPTGGPPGTSSAGSTPSCTSCTTS